LIGKPIIALPGGECKRKFGGKSKNRAPQACGTRLYQPNTPALEGTYVNSSELSRVLGIGLGLELYLLTLGQILEALAEDSGEVYENIVAAIVIGNEAVALSGVEPLNSSGIHGKFSLQKNN
jgi:hypothetical protein